MTVQYRTIKDAGVLAVSSLQGRLRFEGPDAASFLHALVTNDVEGLSPGEGCYAAWLTPQGRMITDLRLFRDDTGVTALVPEGMAATLCARFDQLIFSEHVQVTDVTAESRACLVVGAGAPAAVASVTGADAGAMAALPMFGHLRAGGIWVTRTDETALPTFGLWMPAQVPEPAVLAEYLSTPDVVAALRIDAGIPQFGVDMTTDTIPLEAGLLTRAISQTKGCYVGQEVIVRILHRGGGKVVRHLVRLAFDPSVTDVPVAGAVLFSDGMEVGVVTSAAPSPSSGAVIALGYVRREFARTGQALGTAMGSATVTALVG